MNDIRKLQSPAFDVYGYRFQVQGSSPAAQENVCQDFAYFRSQPGEGDHVIEILDEDPDYGNAPLCDASIYTPRNVTYRNGTMSYVDYGGRGLGIHDIVNGNFRILSRFPDLSYEAAYLFLLSQIGQFLDSVHLHRLHALAVSINGRSVLGLLPMGGGKSTLAMELLNYPEVRLLSDDSPFIDRDGRAHAFPLRLGLLPGRESEIPRRYQRVLNRMEFGPKILVDYEYFADRVSPVAEPGIVFLGRRTLSEQCRIERAPMMAAIRAVITNSVVGLGLFHGLEFILENSPVELVSRLGTGFSRLQNCLQMLLRSEVYYLHLGRSTENNARTVFEFASRALTR